MKPDWKDAPEWANWLSRDADQYWSWHEFKPYIIGFSWYSAGKTEMFHYSDSWTDSMEAHPNAGIHA